MLRVLQPDCTEMSILVLETLTKIKALNPPTHPLDTSDPVISRNLWLFITYINALAAV